METLIKRFEEIIKECPGGYGEFEVDMPLVKNKCAQECKQVAIEFAKHYLSKSMEKYYYDQLKSGIALEEYRTPEMDVLLGELIKNGSNNFTKFLEEYGK